MKAIQNNTVEDPGQEDPKEVDLPCEFLNQVVQRFPIEEFVQPLEEVN